MRDLDVKKDSDRFLKILAVIVLAGAAFLVLAVVGVGVLMWWLTRPQPVPESEPPPLVANGWPPIQPQPPAPVLPDNLQALPPAPELGGQPAPPPPPLRKQMDLAAVRSFTGHAGPVFSAAISPDGHRVISGGGDRTVRLWNLDTGKELARLEGHAGAVRDVAFAPDGKRAISAADDGILRLWDLDGKKTVRTFAGHDGGVRCAAFTPDGKQLLSGGEDRSLRVWDIETGRQTSEVYGHDASVLCVAISSDGTHALTGGADGGAMYWDLQRVRPLSYLSIGKPVYFALFAPDGKRVVLGGDAPARLCDVASGEQFAEETGVGDHLRGAALLSDGALVLHGDGKRLTTRRLWTRQRGGEIVNDDPKQRGDMAAHAGPVTCVRLSGDGRLALTTAEDGVVKLWRITERPDNKGAAN